MDLTVTLTSFSSPNVGPFDIKITNNSNVTRTYSTGVSRATLAAGYTVLNVLGDDILLSATSTGGCTTQAEIDISVATGASLPSGYVLAGTFNKLSPNTCTVVGTLQIYLSTAEYNSYTANTYNFNNTGPTTSNFTVRDSAGNVLEDQYFKETDLGDSHGTGYTWYIDSGTLNYFGNTC